MKTIIDTTSNEVIYYRESLCDNYKIHFDISEGWFHIFESGDFLDCFDTWREAYQYFKGLDE